jgi:hypothetical protein
MRASTAAPVGSPNTSGRSATVTNGLCGDFACGQRCDGEYQADRSDFAAGLRQMPSPVIAGDFATGVRTERASRTVGSFASGR